MANFCSRCGKAVNEGEKFCDGCGNALDAPPVEEPRSKPKFFLISGILGLICIFFATIVSIANNTMPARLADPVGQRAHALVADIASRLGTTALVVALIILIIGIVNRIRDKTKSVK